MSQRVQDEGAETGEAETEEVAVVQPDIEETAQTEIPDKGDTRQGGTEPAASGSKPKQQAGSEPDGRARDKRHLD